ncbi:MAG TPA: MarR family transcriptional regulator [Chloroflexota bacterium]|nr:MarR family transcriptional regulator [Chloroflexota bacterium]
MIDQSAQTAQTQSGARAKEATTEACIEALEHVTPRLGHVFKSQLREGPLTMQQMFMLHEIHDGARPSELARRCCISSSATTAALDGLVRGGYCVRTHSEKDRREVLVQATPAGVAALNAAQAGTTAALRELLHGWDEERLQRLLVVLRDLDTSVDAYLEKPGR